MVPRGKEMQMLDSLLDLIVDLTSLQTDLPPRNMDPKEYHRRQVKRAIVLIPIVALIGIGLAYLRR